MTIAFADGRKQRQNTLWLDEENSRAIFERTHIIKSIAVGVQLPA